MSEPSKRNERGQASAATRPSAAPNVAELLKRYGISIVPRPVYEWGGYRYSNPEDAIAAAKRAEAR
ncbi:MAG TPA: hypothetical protein VFH89_12105 [Sphingomicrobium sp.]|nr:hypothetical protein [Sphingomicrobium sp.]